MNKEDKDWHKGQFDNLHGRMDSFEEKIDKVVGSTAVNVGDIKVINERCKGREQSNNERSNNVNERLEKVEKVVSTKADKNNVRRIGKQSEINLSTVITWVFMLIIAIMSSVAIYKTSGG